MPASAVKDVYPGHKATDKPTFRHRLVQISRALVLRNLSLMTGPMKARLSAHLAGKYHPVLAMRMGEGPCTWVTHVFRESLEHAQRDGVRLYGPKVLAVPGELSAGEYQYLPRLVGKFLSHEEQTGRYGGRFEMTCASGALLYLALVWRRAEADGLLDLVCSSS